MKTVQAIILAGGYGTRLLPLTEDKPKPLIDILGKSVLERVCERVLDCEITNITVTAMYKPEMIERHLKERFQNNIKTVREKIPLGTAGAVKNAYDGKSEAVLVLSGDGIFDFDLKNALDFHFSSGADVTIAAARSENPLDYGVILAGSDGKIEKFCEKPSWEHVISSLVNTGIYVLNSDCLNSIPKGCAYDFSKQLFPYLMEQRKKLYACKLFGYWCDIGNLDDYFSCVSDALSGKIDKIDCERYTQDELYELGVDFEMPVCISKSAHIGKNVSVGKNCCIGRGCVISDDCIIRLSVISENCIINEGSGIYGSILSDNVTVGENCVISEGSVIGSNSKIADGVILKKHTRLHSFTEFSKEENMKTDFYGRFSGLFCERGICCGKMTKGPEYFTKLGYAISLAMSEQTDAKIKTAVPILGILSDYSAQAALAASCIKNGAAAGGIKCCDFGKGYESLSKFISAEAFCDIVVFVKHTDESCYIKLYGNNGFVASSEFEKSLEKNFCADMQYVSPKSIPECEIISGYHRQYYGELIKFAKDELCGSDLSGFEYCLQSDGVPKEISPSNLFIKALGEFGAKYQDKGDCRHSFFISPDGTGVYYEDKADRVGLDHNHINAILIKHLNLQSLALYENAPEALRVVANSRNIPVYAYSDLSGIGTRVQAKDRLSKLWLSDGLFAAAALCIVMHRTKKSAAALLESIPQFDICIDEFVGGKNRASVMEKLYQLDSSEKNNSQSEGVKLILANGTVTVVPGRISGFKIISEAQSTESAKELCRKIEDIIASETDK